MHKKNIMSQNNTVLSYKESLLRESDVDLLKGPYWLNDTIISFYFEYLETERFKNKKMLLFVPPEVTQCIKIAPEQEIHVFLDPLLAEANRKFMFFALNDHELTESSGGSHWSLLVFSRPEGCFFHFDSSNGTNHQQAYELSQKLIFYFKMHTHQYEDSMCLQQNNGYDCGIHVLCNTENLSHFALHYNKIDGCPLIEAKVVGHKRLEILDIIENLQKHNSFSNYLSLRKL
ncbi:unnamed protein product [Brassicogethes aeneus]|uniref:Ubiquitin-like protease family profile domain-containing protein n=1 Tax=Brassicogethes aeneus TaxID=1431903 RepID=A0A9P0BIJ1_BRAAE|nr:unnamed protein product [Brassicogethes aeneus]